MTVVLTAFIEPVPPDDLFEWNATFELYAGDAAQDLDTSQGGSHFPIPSRFVDRHLQTDLLETIKRFSKISEGDTFNHWLGLLVLTGYLIETDVEGYEVARSESSKQTSDRHQVVVRTKIRDRSGVLSKAADLGEQVMWAARSELFVLTPDTLEKIQRAFTMLGIRFARKYGQQPQIVDASLKII